MGQSLSYAYNIVAYTMGESRYEAEDDVVVTSMLARKIPQTQTARLHFQWLAADCSID